MTKSRDALRWICSLSPRVSICGGGANSAVGEGVKCIDSVPRTKEKVRKGES